MSKPTLVVVICFVILSLGGSLVFADDAQTIYLKDGTVITGSIISSDTTQLVVKTAFGTVTIDKNQVKKIEYTGGPAKSVAVYMKDGSKVVGDEVRQTGTTISIRTANMGEVTIQKNLILRTEYLDDMEDTKTEKQATPMMQQQQQQTVIVNPNYTRTPPPPADPYEKALALRNWGIGLTSVGTAGFLAISAITTAQMPAGDKLIGYLASSAFLLAGVPMWVAGQAKANRLRKKLEQKDAFLCPSFDGSRLGIVLGAKF